MDEDAQSFQSSRAEVWYLKTIAFGKGESKRAVKIITQNFNGFVPSHRPFQCVLIFIGYAVLAQTVLLHRYLLRSVQYFCS